MKQQIRKNQKPKPKVVKVNMVAKSKKKRSDLYYMSFLKECCLDLSDSYFKKLFRTHFIQTIQCLKFCETLMPPSDSDLRKKMVDFPKKQQHRYHKTLVFDLDETLIHCNTQNGEEKLKGDKIIEIKFPNNDIVKASINVRPHAKEILKNLSKFFEIIIFTASHHCYANIVIDYLDPQKKFVSHRLFRESCIHTE